MIVNASVCSASVRWSTNRNEICGPITSNVTVDDGSVHVLANQLHTNLSNLVPDTNYTLAIFAEDKAGKGNTLESIFTTAVPKGMSWYMYTYSYIMITVR